MSWADKLAEFLRLNDGEQAYTGYPQMQVGLNKPRKAGYATGFLEGATGMESMQPKNPITDPNYEAYEQGKNTGEAVGIGAMAIPGYVAALKAGAPKAADIIGNYMVKTGGIQPMFIGPEAKMWDSKSAFQAAKMEKAGKSPEEIWQATGTGRSLDNAWVQEISDKDIPVLNYGTVQDLAKYPPMKEILGHKELFKNYGTRLSEAPVGADTAPFVNDMMGKPQPTAGSFNYRTNDYTVSPRPAGGTGSEYAKGQRSVLLHELQHGIQKIEDWAQGGNAKTFTQQKDAELARDILQFRKEAERYKGLPNDEIEAKIKADYKKMGAEDWLPSQEVINLAFDVKGNPNKELEALKNLYGLDRKTSPYTPEQMYNRLAGEAQSRLTQLRENLTAEERRQKYPFKENKKDYGLDINPEEAIIHKGDEIMTRKELLQKLINSQK